MSYTENGVNSKTFINALAKAKKLAEKECYSFNELVESIEYEYHLTKDEVAILREKLISYCKKNYLYVGKIWE